MQDSRRSFVSKLGGGVAAATVSGYGRPLRRELKLKITNPDAVVEDPRVKGREFPPSVVTAGGRRFVFMSERNTAVLHAYPKFLSGDGSSHYEIDEAEPFYILGTKPHALVYRELSIEV